MSNGTGIGWLAAWHWARHPPAPSRPPLRLIETEVVTLDFAIDTLRTRLSASGLGERLEVSAGEGTVVAAGEIKEDHIAAWRSIQGWFDERFGRDMVLDSRVTLRKEPEGPPLSVRAIWTGDSPYIIASNGQKYSEGSVLDSGWRIVRIRPDTLELSRKGETLHLAL